MANPFLRNFDLNLLHPVFRKAVVAVQKALDQERIPLKVFEAFRYPERQADLYAQGRTKPGKIITYAETWRSYHQYGLAVDFVFFQNGQWNWGEEGEKKKWWKRLHELGRKNGLTPLNFETPHLQLVNTSSNALYHGAYPDHGDNTWAENLAAAIAAWHGSPTAPPPPVIPLRPPIG